MKLQPVVGAARVVGEVQQHAVGLRPVGVAAAVARGVEVDAHAAQLFGIRPVRDVGIVGLEESVGVQAVHHVSVQPAAAAVHRLERR